MEKKRPPRRAARPRRAAKPLRAAKAGRESDMFERLFDVSPAKLAIGTPEGTLVEVNKAYAEFFGFTPEEMIGKSIAELGIIGPEEMGRLLKLGRGPGAAMRDEEVAMRARDGRPLNVLMTADILLLDGKPYRLATLVDVTERKRTQEQRDRFEAQLARAQKMESVGRLAGGIAHDFNNILTAMSGYAKFVLDSLPTGDARHADMGEILLLIERAARLTNQLLAFSRKQIMVPQLVDLNAAVGGMASMLKRLIGEHIALRTALEASPSLVLADPGQIEQVLLNLAVNARDAMPSGGELWFETRVCGEECRSRGDMKPGRCLMLAVRDTGCGMPEEVRARAFEPFFTTKQPGKGTGLGLSMVHGIVKQSGGEIELDSAPGRGTAVRIYLPVAEGRAGSAEERPAQASPGGSETLLLVEDEDAVRRVAERFLSGAGYRVLSARGGGDALSALERHGRPVDLLLTDVVMPGMGGRELALEAARRRLTGRTLFMSGHAEHAIVVEGILEPGLAFLTKPFSREGLLRKVREVLDGPAEIARP